MSVDNQFEYLRRMLGIGVKEQEAIPVFQQPAEEPITASKNIFIPAEVDFSALIVEDIIEGAWTPLPVFGDIIVVTADTDAYIGVGEGIYGFPLWARTYIILRLSRRVTSIRAKAISGSGKIFMQCFSLVI